MTIYLRGDHQHAASEPSERDRVLAAFADISLLGRGRHASLYRAREIASERWVALKVLDVPRPSAAALEAFDREATALATLGAHPNIVTLHRRVTLGDHRPMLVLDLCGLSLAEAPTGRRDGAGRLSAEEVVAIGIRLAGALDTAHRAGVLHRDVTPRNVLRTRAGEPALSDFAVAALHGSPPVFERADVHSAPELLDGRPGTEATDVYGLASTLYTLLTGTDAFRGYAGESPAALSLRILYDAVAPIHAATVPLALSDVLLWAMAKDPAQRPPSAAWLASELARIAAQQGWRRTELFVCEPAVPAVRRRSPGRGRWGRGAAAPATPASPEDT